MVKQKKKKVSGREKELEDQLKRALADYANLTRRIEEEKKIISDHLKSTIFIKILPVLDNLEIAYKHLENSTDQTTRQGLDLSIAEFKKILQEEGIEEIGYQSEFDPAIHDPVEVVPGKNDGKIDSVISVGYRIGDKILRPAKVKVFKK